MASRNLSVKQIKRGAVSLLTPEQVAERLSVAVQTLAHWRVRGIGPDYVHLSARCVRYPETTLEQWLMARMQSSTAENCSD